MVSGVGLGLRSPYVQSLLTQKPPTIQWVEILADQYLDSPEFLLKQVDAVVEQYPCVLHCVNMSLASSGQLSARYLKQLDRMVKRWNPDWVSDHLCLSKVGDIETHDLLPFPFTTEYLDLITHKIDQVQTRCKRPFLIENISSYLRFNNSTMTEVEFIQKLIEKTGCGILLDVNNVFVSAHNHSESPEDFLAEIPWKAVKQIHLAGAEKHQDFLIDTHSRPVSQDVLTAFQKIQKEHGPIPTCLEWDNDLPGFEDILREVNKIEKFIESC